MTGALMMFGGMVLIAGIFTALDYLVRRHDRRTGHHS